MKARISVRVEVEPGWRRAEIVQSDLVSMGSHLEVWLGEERVRIRGLGGGGGGGWEDWEFEVSDSDSTEEVRVEYWFSFRVEIEPVRLK